MPSASSATQSDRLVADVHDVAVLTATVLDAKGRVIQAAHAQPSITVTVAGKGALLGVGNGDPPPKAGSEATSDLILVENCGLSCKQSPKIRGASKSPSLLTAARKLKAGTAKRRWHLRSHITCQCLQRRLSSHTGQDNSPERRKRRQCYSGERCSHIVTRDKSCQQL
jgi:hypothetical protein